MIDFHCHLDLYSDPVQAAAEANASKAYILSVTTTPSAWAGTNRLTEGMPRIRTAVGLHPALAAERIRELELFDEIIPKTNYVGEIGLDGSPEFRGSQSEQVRVFETVLASCSHAGGRITTIHSRRAADQVLDKLAASPASGLHILHWFSGNQAELQRAIDIGCWFSVGPAMLRGARGYWLTSKMPRDRILTETDGPFATHGTSPLRPGAVIDAVDKIAKAWSCTNHEVSAQLLQNLKALSIAAKGHKDPSVSRLISDHP